MHGAQIQAAHNGSESEKLSHHTYMATEILHEGRAKRSNRTCSVKILTQEERCKVMKVGLFVVHAKTMFVLREIALMRSCISTVISDEARAI